MAARGAMCAGQSPAGHCGHLEKLSTKGWCNIEASTKLRKRCVAPWAGAVNCASKSSKPS
eukprot:9980564-Prorocentrum_lima.AAC.1